MQNKKKLDKMRIIDGIKGAFSGWARSRAQRNTQHPTTPIYRRWWVLLIAGIIGTQALMAYDRYANPPPPPAPPMTAEEQAAQIEFKVAQRIQEAKDREALSRVLQAVAIIKESMKNPASFDLVSAILVEGDAVCLVYRGTNSFNATITEQAAAMGAVVSKSPKQWNKYCADKTGTEYADRIRSII